MLLLLTLALATGKVILEAVILTAVLVVSLTLYTFWAAKRGQDFNFLGPFLFGAIIVLMVFALIQVCSLVCLTSCTCEYLTSAGVFLVYLQTYSIVNSFYVADSVPTRQNFCNDLWMLGCCHILWVHNL